MNEQLHWIIAEASPHRALCDRRSTLQLILLSYNNGEKSCHQHGSHFSEPPSPLPPFWRWKSAPFPLPTTWLDIIKMLLSPPLLWLFQSWRWKNSWNQFRFNDAYHYIPFSMGCLVIYQEIDKLRIGCLLYNSTVTHVNTNQFFVLPDTKLVMKKMRSINLINQRIIMLFLLSPTAVASNK